MLSLLSRGGESSSRLRGCPTLSGHQGAQKSQTLFVQFGWYRGVIKITAVPWNVPWGGFFRPTSQTVWEEIRMKELAKQYDPSQVEDRIYQFWLDGGYFHTEADPD